MDLQRGLPVLMLASLSGGSCVEVGGAGCLRDRFCPSGFLSVWEGAEWCYHQYHHFKWDMYIHFSLPSGALGRRTTVLTETCGEHEKSLDRNPFCAFAIG
jgi:hypothetical protein